MGSPLWAGRAARAMRLQDFLTDRLSRGRYLLAVCFLTILQDGLVAAFALSVGQRPALDWILFPIGRVVSLADRAPTAALFALAVLFLASTAFLVLSYRRLADMGWNSAHAVWAALPGTQLLALYLFSFVPSQEAEQETQDRPRGVDRRSITLALCAGTALTLGVVTLGTLTFRSYGWVLFVVAPFMIGFTTGYVANRKLDVGGGGTAGLVLASCFLGGVALIATAVEGVVCIVMAAPLIGGLAIWAGYCGRRVARLKAESPGGVVMSVAVLPALFAFEAALPATLDLQSRQTIEIAAPPDVVWQALVNMDPLPEPQAWSLRLGFAYPLSAQIVGEGVGAARYGRFSTGVARERVTVWDPGRKLAFTVIENAPMMTELSPYKHVHAPHLAGYFTTPHTSFEISPLAGGRSRLVERTRHSLKLDPAPYWAPMVRWVVAQNNARVLGHIKAQAEGR